MVATTRGYGGVPAQERRAQRRAALIEAGLNLFAESGMPGVTVRAVCARARLNDRYFYEHFVDCDALLEAAIQDIATQLLQLVMAATHEAGSDVRAQAHAVTEAALEYILEDSRRGQLLVGVHATEAVHRARLTGARIVADAMSAMTLDLLGGSAPPQRDRDLVAFTMVRGTMELVAAWLRGEYDIDRHDLADLMAAMLLASTDISAAVRRSV